MSGDPASANDDELLNQIDELKARMDRLMRGGSSTSNSALLTEEEKLKAAGNRSPEPGPESPPTARTRVRDLIETEDTEVVEGYPGPKEVVPFPADANPLPPEPKKSVAPPAASPPKPDLHPPAKDGSLISLDGSAPEGRPQAASFDELGNVIQQELARDDSVPPVGSKKGPDLASRFGSRDESTKAIPVPEKELVESEVIEELPTEEEVEVFEDVAEEEIDVAEPAGRSPIAKVVAIWAFTAIASGAIATLHFTGIF
ncbi:MAG: hypothetical protein GY926_22970 [bacterium]|nr:hypothetical protein [bacterium]